MKWSAAELRVTAAAVSRTPAQDKSPSNAPWDLHRWTRTGKAGPKDPRTNLRRRRQRHPGPSGSTTGARRSR